METDPKFLEFIEKFKKGSRPRKDRSGRPSMWPEDVELPTDEEIGVAGSTKRTEPNELTNESIEAFFRGEEIQW